MVSLGKKHWSIGKDLNFIGKGITSVYSDTFDCISAANSFRFNGISIYKCVFFSIFASTNYTDTQNSSGMVIATKSSLAIRFLVISLSL